MNVTYSESALISQSKVGPPSHPSPIHPPAFHTDAQGTAVAFISNTHFKYGHHFLLKFLVDSVSRQVPGW